MNHYFLSFWKGQKFAVSLSASLWGPSYDKVKEQLRLRLPASQFRFVADSQHTE